MSLAPEPSFDAQASFFDALDRVLARTRGAAGTEVALSPLESFCFDLLAALRAKETVLLCGGVMCTLHGAPEFLDRLKARCVQAGVPTTWTAVHCLATCDAGPNLTARGMVFSCRTGQVHSDRQAMRRRLAGGAVRLDERAPGQEAD